MAAKAGEKDAGRASCQQLNVCLKMTIILTKRSLTDKANFKMIAKQDISLYQRKAKALVHNTDVFSLTPNWLVEK